jgi:hypothetical protein
MFDDQFALTVTVERRSSDQRLLDLALQSLALADELKAYAHRADGWTAVEAQAIASSLQTWTVIMTRLEGVVGPEPATAATERARCLRGSRH